MLFPVPPAQHSKAPASSSQAILESAARAGDPKAAYILGRRLGEGAEDGQWFHLSASKGYAPARAFLALYFVNRAPLGNDSEARKAVLKSARTEIPNILQDLIKGAEAGDIECMTSIPAVAQVRNSDVPSRLTRQEASRLSIFWLRRAVREGKEDAIYRDGLKYELVGWLRESNETVDRGEVLRLLRQSAQTGYLPSVLDLMRIYRDGDEKLGVERNTFKAAYWEAMAERIEPGSTVNSD